MDQRKWKTWYIQWTNVPGKTNNINKYGAPAIREIYGTMDQRTWKIWYNGLDKLVQYT